VLGELLHSLSQPLTGLLCSLELSLQLPLDCSLEQVAEQQQANVSVALQQTERVIGMIQLMREYLDAEQPAPEAFSSALAPATRSVVEELSSIAAVRSVRVRLVGTCAATVPVPESRLRLALQYLIATLIEAQPVGGKVMLLLGEGPAGAVLRAEGERGFRRLGFRGQEQSAAISQTKRDHAGAASTSPSVATLRRVRLAIASRVLESAGASLVFGDGDHAAVDLTGFVLRIPRRFDAPAR
jgi:signal transduction histidine kinase